MVDDGVMTDPERLVSLPFAARRLGVGIGQLRRARDEGAIVVYQVGSWQRCRLGDVLRWLESKRVDGRRAG